MTQITTNAPTIIDMPTKAQIKDALERMIAAFQAARKARKDYAALKWMSSHMLRDIGVDPASVHRNDPLKGITTDMLIGR